MILLGIDIGMINLAMVQVEIDDDTWNVSRIHMCQRIDLCKLTNSRETVDRVSALVDRYAYVFNTSDVILLERQPLCGMTHVEELLFFMFRNKCHKVSPNSVHKYLGINTYDYEGRKEKSVARAKEYLGNMHDFNKEERQHDMADAMCILFWWIEHNRPKGPNPFEKFRH